MKLTVGLLGQSSSILFLAKKKKKEIVVCKALFISSNVLLHMNCILMMPVFPYNHKVSLRKLVRL